MENYVVYYPGCCEEHGGPEMDWYETLEEAQKNCSDYDMVLRVVERNKK